MSFWITVWNKHLQNGLLVKDIASCGFVIFNTNQGISWDYWSK